MNVSALLSASADRPSWHPRPISLAIMLIMGTLVLTYIRSIVKYRREFSKKESPGYSLWFGSVAAAADIYKTSPQETHPHCTFTLLSRKYNLKPLFYLDYWPFFRVPQMIICDPKLAAQVAQTKSLPKPPLLGHFIKHLTGATGMILLDGVEWRAVRALFNPGFSAGHLMTLMGSIVDDTVTFRNILSEHADAGDIFPIEEAAALLTLDIMGKIVLSHDLHAQTSTNELVVAFRGAISWTPSAVLATPFSKFNPLRIYHKWNYERRVNSYIGRVIDERFATVKRSETKKKPAIDLAYDEYVRQIEDGTEMKSSADFRTIAMDQMKTFIFAGHDTSSSATAMTFYLLSHHPEAMAKIRAEHDEILGVDISAAPDLLKKDPNIINKLPYTLAVIKETLRLYPTASSAREGHPDVPVVYNGEVHPTAGYLVLINQHTMFRNPELYPSPDEFIPERFLPSPNNFQDVVKDSFRPFEKGPRACIGQELALMEIKVFLALTIREFDFKDEFEENDRRLGREKPGDTLDGKRGMFGYRAYSVLVASAKPVDGMPMSVKKRVV